jgi:predicted SnoaL-like aldol condensation-catalyzing enzyme
MKKIIIHLFIGGIIWFVSFSSAYTQENSGCEKRSQMLEANKKLVSDMYQKLFGDKNIEAINQYIADDYIQHNPNVADGKQALINAARQWFLNAPKEIIDIQHIVAENDLVFIHTRSHHGDKTVSVIDIFRIRDGKIVEHWDVMQQVPEKSQNNHPMF